MKPQQSPLDELFDTFIHIEMLEMHTLGEEFERMHLTDKGKQATRRWKTY